jgi:DNA-binding GntR family transcriptional regulator
MTWEGLLVGARVSAADRTGTTPLHVLVAGRLQQLIESGAIPVGSRLENEIDLAQRLGISRPTMRTAMGHLVELGLVTRKPGFGTVVVQPEVRRAIDLTSLYDDLVKRGRSPHTEVLSFDVIPADDAVAMALRIAPRTEVNAFQRVRYANGEPLALMFNVIPVQVARIDPTALAERGLYEILRDARAIPRSATEVIGARAATGAEARALGERRGSAVLTMTRTAWNEHGGGIDYGSHIYRASRYAFELNIGNA